MKLLSGIYIYGTIPDQDHILYTQTKHNRERKRQGTNARKVILEVYTFFVMHCTVFRRKSKHKMDVTAWQGIQFHRNNLWNMLAIGIYYVNFQIIKIKCFLTSSDTKRTLMHLFLFTKSAQRELVSIRTDLCTSICDRN